MSYGSSYAGGTYGGTAVSYQSLNRALETETAQPLPLVLSPLVLTLEQATEVDTATGLTPVALGVASRTLDQATEVDTANGLAVSIGTAPVATGYAAAALVDAPVGYWRLGEASGTGAEPVVDSSGGAHAGTYVGAHTSHPGLVAGTNTSTYLSNQSSVTVPYGAWLNNAQVTLEAIIRPDGVGGIQMIMDRDNESLRTFQWRLNGNHVEFIFWNNSGPYFLTGATALVAGQVAHVAATWDGTTARVYLNGVPDGSVTGGAGGLAATTLPLTFGVHNGTLTPFAGDVDEFAYYATALSSTRLVAHYAAMSSTGPAATTVTLGQATETDTATNLTLTLGTASRTLGQAVETDTATALTPGGVAAPTTVTLGQASDTHTATAFTVAIGPDPDAGPGSTTGTLTGTGGTFTLDFTTAATHTRTFTPAVDGALVIQVQSPTGWAGTYLITDSDGDEVQDDQGDLTVVWGTGETMTITFGRGDAAHTMVTYTWSYAPRASSALNISIDEPEVSETPGGLEVFVFGGQADDTITLSLIGPTPVADFQSVLLDDFGNYESLIVELPALEAGDYYLRVEGAISGSEDVPFTVTQDALAHGGAPAPADTPPVRDPAQHWRFYDLRDPAVTWTMTHNPSSWTNVFPPNDFTHDKTTAVDGQPLTWQAAARPWRMEFTGTLFTEADYQQFVFWSQLRRRFWLIDHRNRAWLITIEQFDAQAQVKTGYPWLHQYTVRTLVFMQGTTN